MGEKNKKVNLTFSTPRYFNDTNYSAKSMNQSVLPSALRARHSIDQEQEGTEILSYFETLIEYRWHITAVTIIVSLLGIFYAVVATPIFRADALVQVEDGGRGSGMLMGELASAFEMKSASSAEVEILRSRYVLTRAVSEAKLNISAAPKRFPIIGNWIAREKTSTYEAGLFGLGGYAWGAETAVISFFRVPTALQGEQFLLTATGANTFTLHFGGSEIVGNGRVGESLHLKTQFGTVDLRVEKLNASMGVQFDIRNLPILSIVEELQKTLVIVEKGKQSGIIGISLEGADPIRTAAALNEVGRQYVRQNVARKSVEAEQSLAFLEKQLPELKRNLESSEAAYNALRNSRGTVDLGEEAKTLLQQSLLSQTRLMELRQKRDELSTRYQIGNPQIQAINHQIQTVHSELAAVDSRIKRMPAVEQDVLRLTRDVKVNTDLYTSLLNSAQQLRLVKASKVGNVRLLDEAVIAPSPVRPNRAGVVGMACLAGLVLGVVSAFGRKALFGGIDSPHDIEKLGLTISAVVPRSERQPAIFDNLNSVSKEIAVLAKLDPTDPAIEALRSFRTSLQFTMLGAKNNIVLITGPTPSLGKTFVSVNFAVVLASTGKKVLVIDSDLRKGYMQRYFGLSRERGLADVIAGTLDFKSAVHRQVLENVDFLSTGSLPPNPAELLEHCNFHNLMVEAASEYDLIIIDSAPILAAADTLSIAPHAGVIFNVVRSNVTTAGEITECLKRLSLGGCSVSGVIFNDMQYQVGAYRLGGKYGKYRYAEYKY
jgi:tyrosine-protein kinase Etk/Wzc